MKTANIGNFLNSMKTASRHPLARKAGGLALVALGIAPVIVALCGIAVIVTLCVNTMLATGEKVAGIAAIVGNEIVPQVKKVQASYAAVASQAEQMKSEVSKAMATVTQIQDLSIKQGQLGSTGSLHIQVPDRDVSFGPVTFSDGQLFNQSLPAAQIPPANVAIPMAPLRTALAPLGPDGPVGKAIGASQKEMEAAFGEVTKLQQPLEEIGAKVADWLTPLESILTRVALIGFATLAALAILLAVYVAAGILLVLYRRGEAARVYRTGGVIGFVLFVYQTLLMQGVSRLIGRTPPPSPEQAVAELQQIVARLEAELAALRTEALPRTASPA